MRPLPMPHQRGTRADSSVLPDKGQYSGVAPGRPRNEGCPTKRRHGSGFSDPGGHNISLYDLANHAITVACPNGVAFKTWESANLSPGSHAKTRQECAGIGVLTRFKARLRAKMRAFEKLFGAFCSIASLFLVTLMRNPALFSVYVSQNRNLSGLHFASIRNRLGEHLVG